VNVEFHKEAGMDHEIRFESRWSVESALNVLSLDLAIFSDFCASQAELTNIQRFLHDVLNLAPALGGT